MHGKCMPTVAGWGDQHLHTCHVLLLLPSLQESWCTAGYFCAGRQQATQPASVARRHALNR
jgi:hypothetical protein